MVTEIINTDWFLSQDPPEGTVTFKGKNGSHVDAFSYGQEFVKGEKVEVSLSCLGADLSWSVHFSENKHKEKRLVKINNWEYEGYGEIKAINPVIIDFGDIELETGEWTSDLRVIGEYIYWKIDRLDITKNRAQHRL